MAHVKMFLQFDLERILRTDKMQTISGAKTFPEIQVTGKL